MVQATGYRHSITVDNWQFRQAGLSKPTLKGPTEWTSSQHGRPATEIHVDLIDNGIISDPFIAMNEKQVQWVGEADWEYRTHFTLSPEDFGSAHQDLVFESLDTFVTIYVNDVEVGRSENMFVGQRIPLDRANLKQGENTLRLYFESALKKARKLEKIHGSLVLSNGETSRVHIRKAQYHYGWDWGPMLMTCGPCRDVVIDSYNCAIENISVDSKISENLDQATIVVETHTLGDANIVCELISPDGTIIQKKETTHLSPVLSFSIYKPELWYPIGYGSQGRYSLRVSLFSGRQLVDVQQKTIGLRRAELVQRPLKDQQGTSFFFQINNIPIYCSGSCWIPAHNFVSKLTDQDYTDWLELLANGNQNMIRVWGGGYYERDIFYEECDRLGLLVWQDFMFACGQYPSYTGFLESVSREARFQVNRLKEYCSIVIYAGNNEDYQIAEEFGLEYDRNDTTGDFLRTSFGARHIYENLLPKVVEENCSIPYHPGSPWGGKSSNDPLVGDIHQWNVWHGRQEKYQDWYKLGGRFVSEFGMLAFPNRPTIDYFVKDPAEAYPQSETMDHHNKALGFERRLALYVMENLHVKGMDMDDWIYATQLMQAECLAYAYRCWRREWRGPGREYSAGALVWQANDCWPVTSWAICDYFRRPKLAYYAVKRESSPVWIGLYRNDVTERPPWLIIDPRMGKPFDYIPKKYEEEIWGVNSTTDEKHILLYIEIFNIETGELVNKVRPLEFTLKPNQSTELVKNLDIPSSPHHVVYTKFAMSDKPDKIIARASDWPQPLKYLHFPDRSVKCSVFDNEITLSTTKPIKGIMLSVPTKPDIFFEDNCIDLFPGDPQTIRVSHIKAGEKISLKYYEN